MATMFHWIAFLVLLSPVGTLAAFIVDDSSKSASTCEPFLIQWQGGIAPWTLILEASSESVLENLGTLQATAFKWSVDLAAGTAVLIELQDSTGAVALSKPLIIQPGSTECTLRATTTRQLAITATRQLATSTTRQLATSTTQQLPITSQQTIITRTSSSRDVSVPTAQSRANQQSSSPPFALGFTSASIASLSVHGVASSQALQPVITVTGTGDPSQSAAGPYYEPPAEVVSTLKTPSHIGIILGTAIPLVFLLLFICVFLWRRYRKRTAADHEKLPVVGSGAPPWYMQPAYGFRHSQVTGSAPVASEPNYVPHAPPDPPANPIVSQLGASSDSISRLSPPPNPIVSQSDVSSDSISRLSLPFQPSFVQSQRVSVPEYSTSTTPWTSGGLMEMPPSPSEYPSPPPAY